MDAGLAERLAGSMDPKQLSSLQNRNNDPAVAHAVAAQFGSFLMQGLMQDGDGNALSMAGGTGGAAVNSMFTSAMSRYAMSGDKLGLADMIYRSTAGKAQQAATPQAAAPAAPAATGGAAAPHEYGISLTPYWQGNGHRPLGPAMNHMTPPAGASALAKTSAILGKAATGKVESRPNAMKTALAVNHSPAAAMPAAKIAAPAPASAATPAQTPPAEHSLWSWLGLPSLLHLIFPETPAAAPSQAAAVTAPAAAAPSKAADGAPPPAGGTDAAASSGLLGTHRDSGAAARHGAANVGGGVTAALMEAEGFAQNLAPSLTQAAQRLGVSPRVLLAQAALETGWGHSVVGNNIFGVKAGASWPGATVTAKTHEMEGGRMVEHQGTFRSYGSVGEAVDDYVSLVSASDRYRSAIGAGDNVAAYGQALTAGGYATDAGYVAKLTAVADSPTMSDAVGQIGADVPGQLVSAHG